MRGTIYDISTRPMAMRGIVGYPEEGKTIGGMQRYYHGLVVLRIVPDEKDRAYYGNLHTVELRNRQYDEALEVYGEFNKGDRVGVTFNEIGIPSRIDRIA